MRCLRNCARYLTSRRWWNSRRPSPGKITGRALIMRSVSRAKASAREPSARCRWARLIGLSGSVRVRLQRARQKNQKLLTAKVAKNGREDRVENRWDPKGRAMHKNAFVCELQP